MELRRLQNKFWPGLPIGLYISEAHIHWAVGGKALFGRGGANEVQQRAYTAENFVQQLEAVLSDHLAHHGPLAPVVVGLPVNRTFVATVAVNPNETDAMELLSRYALCSSVPVNEQAADMSAFKVGSKTIATVGSCRKEDISTIVEVAGRLGLKAIRVEPEPWALLRSATSAARLRKADGPAIGLFVADRHVQAILTHRTQPLLWRVVEIPEGMEPSDLADELVPTMRSLELYARQHLGVASVKQVFVEGPKSFEALAPALTGQLAQKVAFVEGPGPTAQAITAGLCLGRNDAYGSTIDLAKTMRPPPSIWQLVPRREAVSLSIAIACMAFWLWGDASNMNNEAHRIERQNAANKVLMKKKDTDLKNERRQLEAETEAIYEFVSSRTLWTEYLNELCERIPPSISLTGVWGLQELSAPGKRAGRKPKQQLTLQFTTPFPHNTTVPAEVEQMLRIVRAMPPVKRDYPYSELASMRLDENRAKKSTSDKAEFLILSVPKAQSQ